MEQCIKCILFIGNLAAPDGDTLLHRAVRVNQGLEVIRFLLDECGIDPLQCDGAGHKASFYCVNDEILRYLSYRETLECELK